MSAQTNQIFDKTPNYAFGFSSDISQNISAKGLNEDKIREISGFKNEPKWLLEFRLKAYRKWLNMTEPTWGELKYPKIDYQNISYFAVPTKNTFTGENKNPNSLEEIDPEILKTFTKLGIPLSEQARLVGVKDASIPPSHLIRGSEFEVTELNFSGNRYDKNTKLNTQKPNKKYPYLGDQGEPGFQAVTLTEGVDTESGGGSREKDLTANNPTTPIAIDAILDSVSVKTTFSKKLFELGIIFCSFSEAVQNHPELIQKYLGSVVPFTDNFFACLNSAVFTDGSFCYIPKGVRCPMELSTYFRINAAGTGQFERTLIVAEADSFVSYLEGCTAPQRDENQLHAAVVELIAHENAEIKYSTVQNWYPGDKNGLGGIYNFVTKRGICKERGSKISWTQIETGSAITWKYPSVILKGDNSIGEFYSVAVTNNHQQADTGTKMIHIGRNTKSRIISKGISSGYSVNTYRGLVKIAKNAVGSRNYTQCDSLILSPNSSANTLPDIQNNCQSAVVEHEATTSKINQDKLWYLETRGIETEQASNLLINGYCKAVIKNLPLEFAIEAQKLLEVSLEGAVG